MEKSEIKVEDNQSTNQNKQKEETKVIKAPDTTEVKSYFGNSKPGNSGYNLLF